MDPLHPKAQGNVRLIVGDVRLPTNELREEIERSDVLYHLAAQVAVTTSVNDPRTTSRSTRSAPSTC